MNYVLNLLKIFIPLFGFIIIFTEEKRRSNDSNKFLLLFLGLILAKEISSQAFISLYGKLFFTTYLPFYYIISFIPMFFFLLLLSKYVTEQIKPMIKICLACLGIVLILCLLYIFKADKYIIFPYIMVFIRIGISVIILYIIIKLNTMYFGDELNIITGNKILINIILTTYIVHYILYFEADNILKNSIELILYSLILIVIYYRIKEGYKELHGKIKHLNFEREIFLNLLQKVGKGLTAEANFDTILELILNYSVEVIKSKAAALLLVSHNKKYLTVKYIHGLYPPTEKVEGYAATKEKFLVDKFKSEKIPIGLTYLGEVAKTGRPLLIEDAKRHKRIIQTAPGLMDIKTLIVVPLKFKDEVIGVVSYCNKEEGGSYTRNEFQITQTLSEQAAITLNNFRLYNELLNKQRDEKELEIAGTIQNNLLPKEIPDIPGYDLFAFNKPAKGVGGDYYDIINFNNENLAVIIADVAGKGVPAALVMVMIRTTLHNILKPNLKPYSIINYLNKFLSVESTKDRYATMFYFLLNVKSKKLIYTNAAHGPLLLFRSTDNKFTMLDTPGLPVGIVEEQKYEQGDTTLKSGDIVMLYTDGITEAMNENRDQFSIEKIKEIIKQNQKMSAKKLGALITEKVNEFVGEAPQHDDQTLILLKVK